MVNHLPLYRDALRRLRFGKWLEMIPPASLQRLAADVLRSSNINVGDQPNAEQIKSDMILSLRSSIYTTLQSYIEPSMKVLIDGINSRPELNFTIGTVLNGDRVRTDGRSDLSTGRISLI